MSFSCNSLCFSVARSVWFRVVPCGSLWFRVLLLPECTRARLAFQRISAVARNELIFPFYMRCGSAHGSRVLLTRSHVASYPRLILVTESCSHNIMPLNSFVDFRLESFELRQFVETCGSLWRLMKRLMETIVTYRDLVELRSLKLGSRGCLSGEGAFEEELSKPRWVDHCTQAAETHR